MWWFAAVAAALLVVGCSMSDGSPSPSAGPASSAVRYVALGDSYTIGTSETEANRWPNQLVKRVRMDLVANLGVNGFTTADLIARELPRLPDQHPDFVTILIGVNDVVQGVSADTYRAHLDEIFDAVLNEVPANRVVVVSTPDYTLTPSGAAFGDPTQQSTEIKIFNGIERENAQSRGIAFVDISSVANRVPQDRTLVAGDGLHPSGKQYAGWVDLIAPVVEGLLAP